MKRLVLTSVALAIGLVTFLTSKSFSDTSKLSNTSINLGTVSAAPDAICVEYQGHARLVCLADSLKASLSPDLVAKLELPYSVETARKWSNLPSAIYKSRPGPNLGELNAEQLGLVKTLLKTAASLALDEGYDEMEQILNADDFLKANASNSAAFSSGNYYLAFLGKPADKGTWQLYFGGHHLALGNTYTDGKLTGATPSFRGVEPFTKFQQNGRDNQPMVQEQAAFAAMLKGLSSAEQAKAKLSQTYTNIILGAQQDDAFPSADEGLRVGEIDAAKQALVVKAIETYVRDVNEKDADPLMAKYISQLGDTFIAFSGTPDMATENDYVRIDGPSLWIEYSMQPGRSIPGIHPHSVWRDRASDYGGNK